VAAHQAEYVLDIRALQDHFREWVENAARKLSAFYQNADGLHQNATSWFRPHLIV
jgi:hypothetical protein